MCVYLFAPSRGQPLCFSLCLNNSATLGKIKTFKLVKHSPENIYFYFFINDINLRDR